MPQAKDGGIVVSDIREGRPYFPKTGFSQGGRSTPCLGGIILSFSNVESKNKAIPRSFRARKKQRKLFPLLNISHSPKA